ncbi:MAG: hypothetical protein ACPGYK_09490 [Flavobacteriales bacterium]
MASLFQLILLVAGAKEPPQISVEMKLDTAVLAIGDQTEFTLRAIRTPQSSGTFVFPIFEGDSIPGGLEVLSFLGADTALTVTANDDDAIAVERRWLVTSWDTGFRAIPPVPVVFEGDTLETNALLLQILTPRIEDPNAIAAPAEVIDVEWTFKERVQRALPTVLLILLILGLLAAGWWAYRKHQNRPRNAAPAATPQVPLEPAHVVALRELESIRVRAVWQRGDEKGHHAATSLTLRTYVERRFGLPALERTTFEIRRGLRGLPMREEERTLLLELLELSDLVKFAKYRALPEEHERIVVRAIHFVESTLPTSEGEEALER